MTLSIIKKLGRRGHDGMPGHEGKADAIHPEQPPFPHSDTISLPDNK